MDPLSISFGVAGLLPLVASAIKLARNYWTGIRGAKGKAETLITELKALETNLNALQSLLDIKGRGSAPCDTSSVLVTCSAACQARLQVLVQKLERPSSAKGKLHALKWPFEEKEHKDTISELHRLAAWMQFSLSIGGYRLLSSSSTEALKMLGEQLNHFEEIKNNQVEIRQKLEQQEGIIRDLSHERQEVLDWVSDYNVQAQQDKIQDGRTENTGSWFLQDPKFLRWRAGKADSRLLWCHGHPGSGKTVLSSVVIDDLSKHLGMRCPVAFFYFSYREADQQDPQAVFSCLLRQVATTLDEIPAELMQMWKDKRNSGRNTLLECKQMMAICLAKTEYAYFVLDALDENDFSKHRRVLLETLHDLAQIQQTRILVTSRSHIQDIAKSFHGVPQIVIEAHDEDLEQYLVAELNASPVSSDLDEDLTARIHSQVRQRAKGMFLLAVLQIRSIINEPTPGEMEDALERMSGDIDGAFEDTISRIQNLPKSRAQLGMDVLMWLCHARRVMSLAELSDALAFGKGRGSKLHKYRPSLGIILECCHGLVVRSADKAYIELAHYSIQEYLESHTSSLFPLFELDMASTCLGYLMLDVFKHGPQVIRDDKGCISFQSIKTRLLIYPFASYAAKFWDKHVRNIEGLQSTRIILSSLVSDNKAMASSVQIQLFERRYRWIYVDPKECLSRRPIHNASAFGLETILATILETPDASATINTKTEIVGSTPIILAASAGHIELVKLLLQHGADPYISNWYGNALDCAAQADQPETIVELVRFGMSPDGDVGDTERVRKKSPLSCTLECDGVSSLIALIRLGASVKAAENSDKLPFLHKAARFGASKIVEYLVRSNLADVHCKSQRGGTALDCAIASRSAETVRILMSVGAGSQQITSKSLAMLHKMGYQLKSTHLAGRDEEICAER